MLRQRGAALPSVDDGSVLMIAQRGEKMTVAYAQVSMGEWFCAPVWLGHAKVGKLGGGKAADLGGPAGGKV